MKNTSYIGLFLVFLTLGNIATNQSISQNIALPKRFQKIKATTTKPQDTVKPLVITVILPKVDSIDKTINKIEVIQNSTSESLDATSENSDTIYKKLKKIHEEKKKELNRVIEEKRDSIRIRQDSINLSKTSLPVIEEICRSENCIEMSIPPIQIPEEKQTIFNKLFKWFRK